MDGRVFNLLIPAIGLMTLSEPSFTFYIDVYGLANLVDD
jgi:hypothetical protein